MTTTSRSDPAIEVSEGVDPAEGRNAFVGASEVGCLFDAHPFLTRAEKYAAVCLDKSARAPTAVMSAGHLAERIVFQLLGEGQVEGLEGLDVTHYRGVRWHDKGVGLAAMPDGAAMLSTGEAALVECKYTTLPSNLHRDYGRWHWWWQVQAQMACSPGGWARRAVIVMLDGRLQLRHWWVDYDAAAARSIRHEVRKFWAEVHAGRLEYRGRHPTFFEQRDDVEALDGEAGERMDELCHLLELARTSEAMAKGEREMRRDAILAALGARGEWRTPRHKIVVSGPKGRTPTIRITERL